MRICFPAVIRRLQRSKILSFPLREQSKKEVVRITAYSLARCYTDPGFLLSCGGLWVSPPFCEPETLPLRIRLRPVNTCRVASRAHFCTLRRTYARNARPVFFLHFSSRYSADFSKPQRAGLRHRINPWRCVGFGGRSCSVGIHRCEHCDKCTICDKQRWRGRIVVGMLVSTRFGAAETVKLSCALAIERRDSSRVVPPTSACSGGVTWGATFRLPRPACVALFGAFDNAGTSHRSFSGLPFPCGFPPPTQTSLNRSI